MKLKTIVCLFSSIALSTTIYAQNATFKGFIKDKGDKGVENALIQIPALSIEVTTDKNGLFELDKLMDGKYELIILHPDYIEKYDSITFSPNNTTQTFILNVNKEFLEDVVVSGTMKEVSKSESPVPVEIYTEKFFKSNPTPSLFDALQNINGVRPQVNCNVCNTGDIHINGLEGPYTMILIDGMPIVSGLATVYGLSGIPQSLIDRIEIVKGPASTLYGSEAVGGLINIITKRPTHVPLISTDVFATSWGEVNADIAAKFKVSNKVQSLFGVNYFNYNNPIDNNNDNFTDITLQQRVSIFNKWNFDRKDDRVFTLAARYVNENRWGGEMNWNKSYRGGDEVYGESIYTNRWELMGNYQLPVEDKVFLQFSGNIHKQNSVYGNTPYLADQRIGFAQLLWFKTIQRHELLLGATYRYTYYDDNTPATASENNLAINQPSITHLPGIFVQDEININESNKVLLGIRYDYNTLHGNIITPRINYKWNSKDKNNILRLSFGNGYRVANVFTEDHSALTGARKLEFVNDLQPEKSWNGNINFVKKLYVGNAYVNLDATAFYTYFNNKIIADYDTDPNKILYDNLSGHAISQGVSLNVDVALPNGLKILAGATLMDVYSKEDNIKVRQLFTEQFTGTWNIGYTIKPWKLSIDYTGNVFGPMRLPLLSESDPRSEYSPWWSIQNIQLTKKINDNIEIYGGVKNLLNWTPNKGNPFIIARAHDPFDRNVQFDPDGQAMKTPDNPYGLTFDPTYVYGPNQGIRAFLGLRYNLK